MVWIRQLSAEQNIHFRRIRSILNLNPKEMQATTKYIAQLFLAGMVCLVSCKKLDLNPTSQLSTTIFWKTPGDADLALTGLYNTLYANNGTVDQNTPYWWDCFSDNAYSQHSMG